MSLFDKRIMHARVAAELTRQQLANMSGIALSKIELIETGKVERISEETLLILAFLLKRAPSYLCGCSSKKWDLFDVPIKNVELSELVSIVTGTVTEEEYKKDKLTVQGNRIKEQREKYQLTQIELATKIGVSNATISYLENSQTLRTSFRRILLLAYTLFCSTDFLCGLSSGPYLNRDNSINPISYIDKQTIHDLGGFETLYHLDPALCRLFVACLRLAPKNRYVLREMIHTYLDAVQNNEQFQQINDLNLSKKN